MRRLFVSNSAQLHKALFFLLGTGQLDASAALRVRRSHTFFFLLHTTDMKEKKATTTKATGASCAFKTGNLFGKPSAVCNLGSASHAKSRQQVAV